MKYQWNRVSNWVLTLKLVGVIGSGSTTVYAPIIIYENAEEEAKEEQLVLVDDDKRGLRYLGVLRNVRRYEPFLNIYKRTSFVDNPSLVEAGILPHTSAYISLIGIIGEDGKLHEAQLPPNPGSKVYIIEKSTDLKLNLGGGLTIGVHKYSNIEIPLDPNGLAYHVAVIGATGTGKSRLVKALIDEILIKTDYKVIVFDHSGLDYVPYYRGNVINASDIALDLMLISDLILERTGLDSKNYEQYVILSLLLYVFGKLYKSGGLSPERILKMLEFSSYSKMRQDVSLEVMKAISGVDFRRLHKDIVEKGIKWDIGELKKLFTLAVRVLGGKTASQIRLCVATDIKLGSEFFKHISNRRVLPARIVDSVLDGGERLVVVDLSGEDIIVKRYVVASILDEVWRRIEETRKPADTIIVVDEAHNYACRYCGIPHKLISRVAREGRKWKLGLILATQRAIDIDPEIRGNINTWIFSKLQTPSDFNEISAYMNLAGITESSLAILGRREFYIAGLMNPLNIPILIKVKEVTNP